MMIFQVAMENGECSSGSLVSIQPHHRFIGFCKTRAKYRQGKKDTAVKVYTISSESKYLLVQNAPSIPDISAELRSAFEAHGVVSRMEKIPDYPRDRFTEVYLVKFDQIMSARKAKRKLDNIDFYGGQLHISYGPEYETVEETMEKLNFRRRWVQSELSPSTKHRNTTAKIEKMISKPTMDNVQSTPGPSVQSIMIGPSEADLPPSFKKPSTHNAISQAKWHRFNSNPSTSRKRKMPRDIETVESKKPTISTNQLDIRNYDTSNKHLQFIPRSILVKRKSSDDHKIK